ncbi:hypothetical protein [Streptomyces zingiberis]|uniref:Uncharacterized protein n=1 Tax=Streptomyces zingiberis TaxID=2053010 RepID=A0ABX1BU75_9ACTN|nr:hypothetical protein [Streptomyces zingiberis]NJQ01262.1 hypothetical protein [Streptomyces zingiberis]
MSEKKGKGAAVALLVILFAGALAVAAVGDFPVANVLITAGLTIVAIAVIMWLVGGRILGAR